jgi:NAD(P)-dependent dehydrogenase (short-subunit alcohol dehydrogenase family)
MVIHDFGATGGMPNYSLTKNASTLALQQVAKDLDSTEVQIVSFHPGAIFTAAARRALGTDKKEDVPITFDSGRSAGCRFP